MFKGRSLDTTQGRSVSVRSAAWSWGSGESVVAAVSTVLPEVEATWPVAVHLTCLSLPLLVKTRTFL
jgi:hypothetical protein